MYDLLKKMSENLASGEFNDVPSIGLLFGIVYVSIQGMISSKSANSLEHLLKKASKQAPNIIMLLIFRH